jgi:hypothetical protein
MKHKLVLLPLLIALFISPTFAQESGWDLYERRTLKEITTTLTAESLTNPDVVITDKKRDVSFILTYEPLKSRVKVTYTGRFKRMSDERRQILEAWFNTTDQRPGLIDVFQHEYLFKEGATEYWIPVQTKIGEEMREDVDVGDKISVFVAWIGAIKSKNGIEHILTTNAFSEK